MKKTAKKTKRPLADLTNNAFSAAYSYRNSNSDVTVTSHNPRINTNSEGKEIAPLSSSSIRMKSARVKAIASVVLSGDLTDAKRSNKVLPMPLLRTKDFRKGNNEIDNTEPIKSWIKPHPKKIKKRSITQEPINEYCLPRDYCEKQKAYYKEIDDFELLEEEISYQDLNKC